MPEITYEDVSIGLLGMSYTLRGQKAEDIGAGMVNAWLAAMRRNGISAADFTARAVHLADSGQFFPSVGEFLKPLLESRPSFAVIKDPVDVLTEEGPAVASRKAAENQELPILENDQKPSLQVTPEQREAAAKRLENAESGIVAQAKEKRVKLTNVLAECKSLPKPATPEEIDDRKKVFRSQMESRA